MLLDQRRMNWRHVAAPRAWQAFSVLRLQLDEIAAATAAMACHRCSRAMKCLQAVFHAYGRLESLDERIRASAVHRIYGVQASVPVAPPRGLAGEYCNEGMSTTCKYTRRPRLWRPGVVPIYRQHLITIALSYDRGEVPGSRVRMIASKFPEINHMTSFLAWLAVDSRKATQLYFASDSRRSFGSGDHFDDCEKLFVASNSPDIFAMLGQDISFPMEAVPKICTLIDQGAIPHGLSTSLHGRTDWVLDQMKQMKADKPGGGGFSVFHGARHNWGNHAVFGLSRHSYVASDDSWDNEEYELNKSQSHAIECDGSGGVQVREGIVHRTESLGSVSRAYFAGFVVALKQGQDKRSGGPPQLVGLGCVGNGRRYGLITTAGKFFRGRQLTLGNVPLGTQWRDEGLEPVNESGKSIRNRRRKVLR